MKQKGVGILPESEINFSSPSVRAKKLFYHVLCAGHFFCDDAYNLKRDSYDSYLVLHVIEGSFSFINKAGEELTAHKNETVIIDCYAPHAYCTHESLESVWVHIAGCNVPALCESIVAAHGNVITKKNADAIKRRLLRLFNSKGMTEEEISLEVYALMMELCEEQAGFKETMEHEARMQTVRDFVMEHLGEDIKVKQLADIAHMSPTHFSRVFKQRYSFSPYEYVLNERLNRAKELLLKSDLPIAEIAYETGFNSEANFVYCFTKNEGLSPGKFRKTGF